MACYIFVENYFLNKILQNAFLAKFRASTIQFAFDRCSFVDKVLTGNCWWTSNSTPKIQPSSIQT